MRMGPSLSLITDLRISTQQHLPLLPEASCTSMIFSLPHRLRLSPVSTRCLSPLVSLRQRITCISQTSTGWLYIRATFSDMLTLAFGCPPPLWHFAIAHLASQPSSHSITQTIARAKDRPLASPSAQLQGSSTTQAIARAKDRQLASPAAQPQGSPTAQTTARGCQGLAVCQPCCSASRVIAKPTEAVGGRVIRL